MWQAEKQNGELIKDKDFGGGLDYVTMQFPLGKYMGGSVGLVPVFVGRILIRQPD